MFPLPLSPLSRRTRTVGSVPVCLHKLRVCAGMPLCCASSVMVPLSKTLSVTHGSMYAVPAGDITEEVFRGDAISINGAGEPTLP